MIRASATRSRSKPRTGDLAEFRERLRNSDLRGLPDRLTIDLATISAADYEALLEFARFRAFGLKVLRTPPQTPPLQEIRRLINIGSYHQALRAIEEDRSQAAPVTLSIEKARADLFLGRFDPAERELAPILSDPRIDADQRGVSAQMLGHAQLELGKLEQARASLETALELGELCGNNLGTLAARLFISRLEIFAGDLVMAGFSLEQAFDDIAPLGSLKWMMGFYRHLSHLRFFQGDTSCLTLAYAGIALARALGDSLYRHRGWLEIVLMSRRFDVKLDRSREGELRIAAAESESDLGRWVSCVLDGEPPHSYTAKRFVSEAAKSSGNPAMGISKAANFDHAQWILDRTRGTFLNLHDAKLVKIQGTSPNAKILAVLAAGQDVEAPKLFEAVWNLNWVPSRHKNTLDVTVHRFNREMKPLRIHRADGLLRLSAPGLVIES